MSIGCFIGVRESYTEEAQDAAAEYLFAINSVMQAKGLPEYVDPVDTLHIYNGGLFGRSELDHHIARCLAELAELALEQIPVPHLGRLASNPYRIAFVPTDFEHPLPTDYVENIAGERVQIWVGSAPRLLTELTRTALLLGIPLDDGTLSDAVARKINHCAPLHDDDDCSLAEDERTAWLVLYEGARLAMQHGVALSLAG